ncbi:hypothetical protein F4808DRAFT_430195 [Astrocystis sublimbata]|nr:hypothetical protein F4808DRAFT_430195 [Astrocystis sublimbata]
MGSIVSDKQYPDASDASLVLTHPTAAEKEQTWRLNHGEWGGALDLPAYLEREPFLASTPLSADGGMVHWILTTEDASEPVPGEKTERSVLASCETIRKRVLYAPRSGGVRDGVGYGIGSVYTYPEFRGKKYAARMLKELGSVLKTWPEEDELRRKRSQIRSQDHHDASDVSPATRNQAGFGASNGRVKLQKAEAETAVCSALWSDIGKKFYAAKGWPAYASEHVEFVASSPDASHVGVSSLLEKFQSQSQSPPDDTSLTLAPVTTRNLAQLCREDEAQLRDELVRRAQESDCIAFAFAPDDKVFRWHWAREDFIASHVFPERPASGVRGMIATVASSVSPSPDEVAATGNGHVNTDGDGQSKEDNAEKETTTRMWAIWTRSYGENAASSPEKNTLYILRLVIDEGGSSSSSSSNTSSPRRSSTKGTKGNRKALQLAFDAIMHSAMDAARASNCSKVHLWNPAPVVRELVTGSAIAHEYVDRESDSISSMMWYDTDGERGGAVDWVANDKYCWC